MGEPAGHQALLRLYRKTPQPRPAPQAEASVPKQVERNKVRQSQHREITAVRQLQRREKRSLACLLPRHVWAQQGLNPAPPNRNHAAHLQVVAALSSAQPLPGLPAASGQLLAASGQPTKASERAQSALTASC